jgi:hypothetical protein
LGSITQTASTLLNQAQSFYASSQGYTDVYNAVTAALQGLTTTPPPGMAMGGIVGSFAGGGIVGNGTFGVDSVLARFAGGGNIALAGGEHVTRASSVNASTLPTLDAINQTGSLPRGSNDNTASMALLGQTLVRAIGGASSAEINAMRQENASLRALVSQLIKAVEANKPKSARPNAKAAA